MRYVVLLNNHDEQMIISKESIKYIIINAKVFISKHLNCGNHG